MNKESYIGVISHKCMIFHLTSHCGCDYPIRSERINKCCNFKWTCVTVIHLYSMARCLVPIPFKLIHGIFTDHFTIIQFTLSFGMPILKIMNKFIKKWIVPLQLWVGSVHLSIYHWSTPTNWLSLLHTDNHHHGPLSNIGLWAHLDIGLLSHCIL